MLAEAEIDRKKEVLAQTLTLRDTDLQQQAQQVKALKSKLQMAKKEAERGRTRLAEQMAVKDSQIEELKLQMSEREVERLLRAGEAKDSLIQELRNENGKLEELKGHYERILEEYEIEVRRLRRRNEELDKGEDLRTLGQQMDVLKMKMMFYEGRQEKVDLADLTRQMETLESKLRQTGQARPADKPRAQSPTK